MLSTIFPFLMVLTISAEKVLLPASVKRANILKSCRAMALGVTEKNDPEASVPMRPTIVLLQ